MKTIFFIFAISLSSFAQTAVQRSSASSYSDYESYLKKENLISFSQAYIQLAAVTELNTPLLEQCLEEIYLGAPFETTCFESVKSLTSMPLNTSRREVLISYLRKLSKVSKRNREFYNSFLEGLSSIRPKGDSSDFSIQSTLIKEESKSLVSDLEMAAWKKAMKKNFDLKEISLLVNGIKVVNLENWKAPSGIFQWSLVSNTHEPIIRLSSFSNFAGESIKFLKALNETDCAKVEQNEPKKFGLLRVDVFVSKKCIVQYRKSFAPVMGDGHLAPASKVVSLESGSSRQWGWGLAILAGAIAAMTLKDKNVEIGFNK